MNNIESIMHNGHEFVDLGLSVNWAVSNIGAKYPEEVGRYFSKEEVHAPELAGKDLAQTLWGGEWRLPTYDELCELRIACEFNIKRIELFGSPGFFLTTIHNDRSIFFPATGILCPQEKTGEKKLEFPHAAYYWSSYEREDGCVAQLAMDDAMCSEQDFGPGIFTALMVTLMPAFGDSPIRPVFTKKA